MSVQNWGLVKILSVREQTGTDPFSFIHLPTLPLSHCTLLQSGQSHTHLSLCSPVIRSVTCLPSTLPEYEPSFFLLSSVTLCETLQHPPLNCFPFTDSACLWLFCLIVIPVNTSALCSWPQFLHPPSFCFLFSSSCGCLPFFCLCVNVLVYLPATTCLHITLLRLKNKDSVIPNSVALQLGPPYTCYTLSLSSG